MCVCVPIAEPVKVGADTVPVAVVTGETPVLVLPVTSFVPLLVEAATTAFPVKVGALFVPDGVPALTADVVP